MYHRDAAGVAPELRDGVERDAVVRHVGRRRNDDVAGGAETALEQSVDYP